MINQREYPVYLCGRGNRIGLENFFWAIGSLQSFIMTSGKFGGSPRNFIYAWDSNSSFGTREIRLSIYWSGRGLSASQAATQTKTNVKKNEIYTATTVLITIWNNLVWTNGKGIHTPQKRHFKATFFFERSSKYFNILQYFNVETTKPKNINRICYIQPYRTLK